MTDLRRRQYVPVSVDVARSRTGQRLLQRFGTDGLLVWILVLAAAKRSFTQGEFEYTSEADGWERLGLAGIPVTFTLKDFFEYTGRIHNTKRIRPHAVQIRAWEEWNTSIKHEQDAERKRRKRAQNVRPLGRTEVEVENEEEATGPPFEENGTLSPAQRAANAEQARRQLERLTGKVKSDPNEIGIPF